MECSTSSSLGNGPRRPRDAAAPGGPGGMRDPVRREARPEPEAFPPDRGRIPSGDPPREGGDAGGDVRPVEGGETVSPAARETRVEDRTPAAEDQGAHESEGRAQVVRREG